MLRSGDKNEALIKVSLQLKGTTAINDAFKFKRVFFIIGFLQFVSLD